MQLNFTDFSEWMTVIMYIDNDTLIEMYYLIYYWIVDRCFLRKKNDRRNKSNVEHLHVYKEIVVVVVVFLFKVIVGANLFIISV